MNLGTAQIIQGNALNLPLPDSSVDLICTSPPYFALRSYQDSGEHYEGQLGSEATPAEFLDALIAATREMVRVLKPTGSLFVNLGDKYAGSHPASHRWGTLAHKQNQATNSEARKGSEQRQGFTQQLSYGVPVKSLMGLPWRYAIRCIDQLGLILRAEIIWSKPNGLPESVTDRVRRSHEQWFHFTVQPRYFAAVDEIREPHATHGNLTGQNKSDYRQRLGHAPGTLGRQEVGWDVTERIYDPRGKLPGSVWSIPTQPLTVPPELGVDHFAAYPMEWPRRIIQGWTPNGICTACGEGRRPITP
jgi:DNA modification methylase